MRNLRLEDLLKNYLKNIFEEDRRLIQRVNRWALTAAPLNPDTYPKGNTKQHKRWELPSQLYPYLHTTEEKCYKIRNGLLSQIVFMKKAVDPSDILLSEIQREFPNVDYEVRCPLTDQLIGIEDIASAIKQTSRIGRLEINLDFSVDLETINKLEIGNLSWIKPAYHLYHLRSMFSEFDRLLKKVQTKAYLTDRRQTGDYPTNREARWETHPESPQFATYTECVKVEVKLLAQIFSFLKAPKIVLDGKLTRRMEQILGHEIEPGSFHCPISGQKINYDAFMKSVRSSEHGRSTYQVAHIVPLATEGGRHNAANISWITELGNRVQGEDSLDDIVEEIFSMARYHKDRLGLTWEEVERLNKK